MKMFFLGSGIDGIASGKPPSDPKEHAEWERLDKRAVAFIYMRVEDEYHYLIEDLESGQAAWTKLANHFQRSTMGHRMAARSEFYEITHDPSRPIEFYIQSLQASKRKMEALGCKIDDTEFKDVLLMHLDPSFHPVRINILTQKAEPTLDDIKSILTSSATANDVMVKSEPHDSVLAARGRLLRSRRPIQSGGSGLVDEKGYQWCNIDSDGCHRCGRTGHFASRCMYNMPQHVKDYIMNSRSLSPPHDRSSPKHQTSPHPNQSSSKHQASSAQIQYSFTSYSPHSYSPSHSPSRSPSCSQSRSLSHSPSPESYSQGHYSSSLGPLLI